MENRSMYANSQAWDFLTWTGFILSLTGTVIGLIAAPIEAWAKAFLTMSVLFMTVSCFGLAKSLRDRHEQKKLVNRISEAKTEKLLSEIREG